VKINKKKTRKLLNKFIQNNLINLKKKVKKKKF